MMKKGEQTKKSILNHASQIFSVRGYAGASMDDLTRAAQLTKGGVYNHFDSKDDLALASFDHTMNTVRERFRAMVSGVRDSRTRLMAVLDLYVSLLEHPVVIGGCPIIYTAVEADDTHPALRDRARAAASQWNEYLTRTLRKGIELGTVKPDIDVDDTADLILAALQGAIVLSKLHDDLTPMRRVVTRLTRTIDDLLIPSEER